MQALAQELNYHPNHLAASLRTGRSKLLGVLVPHIEGTFFASVVHGIETVASQAGFRVMICQSNEDVTQEKEQHRHADQRAGGGHSGVVVAHHPRHAATSRKCANGVLPLVFFDRMLETPNVSAVVLDDYQGAYQATTHLIEQGCRRIAHFAGPQHLNIYRNRRLGYLAALRTYGLPEDEALIITSDMKLADGTAGMDPAAGPAARPAPRRPVFGQRLFGGRGPANAQGARACGCPRICCWPASATKSSPPSPSPA